MYTLPSVDASPLVVAAPLYGWSAIAMIMLIVVQRLDGVGWSSSTKTSHTAVILL